MADIGDRDRVAPLVAAADVDLQRRRPGEPPRVDDRPAARPRPQRPQPPRLPRDRARRAPRGPARPHVDPPGLRAAPVPPRRRGPPHGTRSTSTASTSSPASSSTSSTATSTACRSTALRLTNVYGPRQSLLQRRPRLPARVRAAGPAGRDDLGVRRRPAAARLPPRRRRRDRARSPPSHPDAVGAGLQPRPPRTPRPRCADRRRRRGRRRPGPRSCSSPWPPERVAIDIGSFHGDYSRAKRVLGWEPTIELRRRHRRHRRLLPATTRGTCRRPEPARRGHRDAFLAAAGRVLASGSGPARPRDRRPRGRAGGVDGPRPRRRRVLGAVGPPARARARSASAPATRSSCPRSPPCPRRRRCWRPAPCPCPSTSTPTRRPSTSPTRPPPCGPSARRP